MSFSGSYAAEDVTFLLKPVTIEPTPVADKEAAIQSGRRHYSEMLSAEHAPDARYLALYEAALDRDGQRLADDVASLAAAIDARAPAGREVVLASFARAGTPIGVLLRRALAGAGRRVAHYSISIVRDRGIDPVALARIAACHDPADVVFVDGWTGKGAIAGELARSLPAGWPRRLAVIADPAGVADLAATGDDYLIASGLLGAIVSGLVSRTVLNDRLAGPGDYHACAVYDHLAPVDRSRAFVDRLSAMRGTVRDIAGVAEARDERARGCEALVARVMAETGTRDRNRVKPGIAEATRAVLRRVPERLLLRDPADPVVAHLVHLAAEGGLRVDALPPDCAYRAVAVIKSLGSE